MPDESSSRIPAASRQLSICNACRYCEGYCSVFPALTRITDMSPGAVTQLANLCHNCRGCYYACQYAPPHAFAINLPAILAEVRQDSWRHCAWPPGLGRVFQRSGLAIALLLTAALALLLLLIGWLRPESGEGFYAYLSHTAMVALFLPAFLLPMLAVVLGLRRYWKQIGGERIRWSQVRAAVSDALTLRNLSGGVGQGCQYEAGDRFSMARRIGHQLVLYGFLLAFASTSVATVMHYGFAMPAPYPLWSLPKLFGISGGVALCIGCLMLLRLRASADPALGDQRSTQGDLGFVWLLFLVSASGLVLYAATGAAAVRWLLALHLGAVLAFFLLLPYSKMAHGFYRGMALIRDAQEREQVGRRQVRPARTVGKQLSRS